MPGPATTSGIHSTAIVSPKAELDDGVSVGPYAIIEAGARIGGGTMVMAHAVITSHAVVGRDCQVHYGAVIGHEPQDLSFGGAPSRAVIGDRAVVREYATIHRATREGEATVVGEESYLMAHSHVAHDCHLGANVVVCNSCLVAGHVVVGDRAFLSGNSVIHQFCRVGRLVMLSGTSAVGKDVGPFLIVAGRSDVLGLNTVGMRRAGLDADARRRVKEAYRRLFGAATLEQGLARVEELGRDHQEVGEILTFFQLSQRGFSRPPPGHVMT